MNKEEKKEYMKKWYQENKKKISEKGKAYYNDNKEYFSQKAKERNARPEIKIINQEKQWKRKGVKGMSMVRYKKMLKEQNGKCYICNRDKTEFKNGLVVDHNHNTGEVRKLLCTNCNTGIGQLQDDKEIIFKAYEYIKKEDNNVR